VVWNQVDLNEKRRDRGVIFMGARGVDAQKNLPFVTWFDVNPPHDLAGCTSTP